MLQLKKKKMNNKLSLLLLPFFVSFGLLCCAQTPEKQIELNEKCFEQLILNLDLCGKVKFLEAYYYHHQNQASDRWGNIQYLIGQIEKESNIDANCDRTTFGMLYRKDEDFEKDLFKWRNAGCKN
jgi:hypothetical protein